MKIGFTGTRQGMTAEQRYVLICVLTFLKPKEFHHGDCIGADEQASNIARDMGCRIVIHPPLNNKFRAYCSGDKVLPPKDYLERNRDIVDRTDILVATPKQFNEVLRSGTWATIRYARKTGKPQIIIFPDGGIGCARR